MRYLRGFGLAALAALALVAGVVATASAAEAGLLYLAGESGQVTFEGLNGTVGATFTSLAARMHCTTVKVSGHSAQTEKHITTGLTADAMSFTTHFVKEGELCDTEDAFCKKAQEKANELLQKFAATFEKCELEMEVPLTLSKMVLIDD